MKSMTRDKTVDINHFCLPIFHIIRILMQVEFEKFGRRLIENTLYQYSTDIYYARRLEMIS